MDEKTAYIYGLCDPDTGEVKYVGKTEEKPRERYKAHLANGNLKGNTLRTTWIKSLKVNSKEPALVILEKCKLEDWQEYECQWIAFFRSQGNDLKNSDDGGMGGMNRATTAETRAKLSAFQTGKAWNKGRTFSEEWRKHLSDAQRRRYNRGKLSDEQVREIRRIKASGRLADREVGEPYGVSEGTVAGIVSGKSYSWVKNEDGGDYVPVPFALNGRHGIRTQDIWEVRELSQSTSRKEIVQLTGIPLPTVSGIILGKVYASVTNRDGTDYIPPDPRSRRLSPEQVKTIRARLSMGWSRNRIARELGHSRGIVSGIRDGKLYTDV